MRFISFKIGHLSAAAAGCAIHPLSTQGSGKTQLGQVEILYMHVWNCCYIYELKGSIRVLLRHLEH